MALGSEADHHPRSGFLETSPPVDIIGAARLFRSSTSRRHHTFVSLITGLWVPTVEVSVKNKFTDCMYTRLESLELTCTRGIKSESNWWCALGRQWWTLSKHHQRNPCQDWYCVLTLFFKETDPYRQSGEAKCPDADRHWYMFSTSVKKHTEWETQYWKTETKKTEEEKWGKTYCPWGFVSVFSSYCNDLSKLARNRTDSCTVWEPRAPWHWPVEFPNKATRATTATRVNIMHICHAFTGVSWKKLVCHRWRVPGKLSHLSLVSNPGLYHFG